MAQIATQEQTAASDTHTIYTVQPVSPGFNDIATARDAMDAWLTAEDREGEDTAFILPIFGRGLPTMGR